MFSFLDWRKAMLAPIAVAVVMVGFVGLAQAQPSAHPGVGRAATAKEVAAWDIDVRPDFKGLPKGAGSVAQGMVVWESKCASCHGVFGESNEVFSPIVGGTTKDDIKTGRVARLNDNSFPGRTTLMKVSNLSTLWDYINRAMPWTAPKSLSTQEVYAVTAYILNMGDVLSADFTLSDKNMAEVQALLPNRNGKTTDHALWPGAGFGSRKADVQATACMNNCAAEQKVASFIPDFARNAHGNLAEQNRTVGAQRGVNTSQAAGAPPSASAPPKTAATEGATALLQKHTCVACHGMDSKLVGPAFREIANKYSGRADAAAYLAGKVKAGGSGVWGSIPMPAQALSEAEAHTIATWLADGAKK
jgi:S-disulfanyl-L-cysteine oxidoreductase SoxD